MLGFGILYPKNLFYVIFKTGGSMDCLFCKINDEIIPSKTLYEDDIVKVIMDIKPVSDGHLLVIPKIHIDDFLSLDESSIGYIFEITKKMKEHLYIVLEPDGLTLKVNYGIKQEIKHFHLHIIPVYKNKSSISSLDLIYDKINKQINLSKLMNLE